MGSSNSCCQNNEDLALQAVASQAIYKQPVVEDNFSKESPTKHNQDNKLNKSTINLTTQAGRTVGDVLDLLEMVQNERSFAQANPNNPMGDTRPLHQIDNEFSIAGQSGIRYGTEVDRSLLLADLSVIPNH